MDIRWQQRFQNFERAFTFLQGAVEKEEYTPIEIGGLVQAFEFTFELAWKTIKDYLYEQGIEARFPREAIKEAFATQIIQDGHTWIEMLEKRNELSHTYNEEVAERAVRLIKDRYFDAVQQVYKYLKAKADPDLETLLLNGPTATKRQLNTVENNRRAVNQWRTKS